MRTRGTALLALALALTGAGCGMKNPSLGPSYAQSRAALRQDAALVYVYRYNAEPPRQLATVLLDGAELVDLSQRGFTWFYAAPGRHRLTTRWPPISGQHPAELGLDLRAGELRFVELSGVHRTTGHAEIIASTLEEHTRDAAEKKLSGCELQKPRLP